jgi:hypothetical protein
MLLLTFMTSTSHDIFVLILIELIGLDKMITSEYVALSKIASIMFNFIAKVVLIAATVLVFSQVK